MNSSVERVGVADKNHVDDHLPTYMSFKMGRAAAVHNGLGRHHIDFTKANCHRLHRQYLRCLCDPALTMLHSYIRA